MQKVLLAVIAAALVAFGLTGPWAVATHEPADKTAAAASDIDTIDDTEVILEETMRVSSTSDLILATTAECSILTSLFNPGSNQGGASDTQGAFGQVEMYITIDGNRVPVSTDDRDAEEGEVVFCNRAYTRKIADKEQDEDGIGGGDGYDQEDDFIRTRTANGFNWMAFNVGVQYDEPANGNNIVDIKLHAEYTRAPHQCEGDRQVDEALVPYGETCADALVGSRTLIVEAVHASTHETASATGVGN